MTTSRTTACAALAALALAGCATKNYGTMDPVTAETPAGDCAMVQAQLAETGKFRKQVAKESEFGGADVLAFLIDFGIGNAMAKHAALESADKREAGLKARQAELGCRAAVANAPTLAPAGTR